MTAPDRSPSNRGIESAASRRVVQVLLGVALVAVAFATPARPSADVEASFGGGESPCLAQVVGLAASEVLWFDGTPFFSRQNHTGETHLYVTESGAPDPTSHVGPETLASADPATLLNMSADGGLTWEEMPVLIRSGQHYEFTDANGVTWNVTEAYLDVGPGAHQGTDHRVIPKNSSHEGEAHGGTVRYYTWVVEIGEVRDDANIGVPSDIGDGGEYNFATRVNTSKFTSFTRDEGQNVTHTNTTDAGPGFCHPDHNHTHRQYDADLWLGGSPETVPVDCEPLHAVSASFLAEYTVLEEDANDEATAHLHGSYRGGTCTGVNGTEGGAP